MPRAKQSPGKRPTSHNADMADRQRKAMELKIAGATFDQIAAQLGYADASGAWRAVCRGLIETQRPVADEYRALTDRRLERLLLSVWPAAIAGDLKANEQARRIIADLRRLWGTDMPVKVDATVTQRTETDAALQALVDELERRAQPAGSG